MDTKQFIDTLCEDGLDNNTIIDFVNTKQARIDELEAMLRKKLDLIKCGIGGNYSGSPYENPLYTEVTDLLENT
jgi:hypothetical protein